MDKLMQLNYDAMIRPNGSQRYIGTVFIRNNALLFYYESDAGYYPTIMAYAINDDNIKLIIKYRWERNNNEVAHRYDGKLPSYYYLVEIKENNKNEITYDCTLIENMVLDNFIIAQGVMNDDNVNIRESPSLDGKKITKVNGLVRQPGWLSRKSCNFSPYGCEIAVFSGSCSETEVSKQL